MRSPAAVAWLVTAAIGILGVVAFAGADERELAFTLGVAPYSAAAQSTPGSEACQLPIDVPERFTGVVLKLAPPLPPGPRLDVLVRRLPGRSILARGVVEGGYRGLTERSVALDRAVPKGQRIAVCVVGRGRTQVALFGNAELAHRTSHAEVDGETKPTDIALVFTREPRSVLSQVPEIFERASLFHPPWVGPWTYWLLAALVLLGAPALLARALADVFRDR